MWGAVAWGWMGGCEERRASKPVMTSSVSLVVTRPVLAGTQQRSEHASVILLRQPVYHLEF